MKRSSEEAFMSYNAMTGEDIARELARIVLPVNAYTEWYWKIDLHNLLHFLKLRLDSHAQYEIRVYAEAIAEVVKKVVISSIICHRRTGHLMTFQFWM